jgi:transcriptional regulator with XRE-family HTH domain
MTRTVMVVDDSWLDRAVGERVKRARLERKLTQRQVAQGRFTSAYISAIENGKCHPSLSALAHIAERLDMSMRDFLPE